MGTQEGSSAGEKPLKQTNGTHQVAATARRLAQPGEPVQREWSCPSFWYADFTSIDAREASHAKRFIPYFMICWSQLTTSVIGGANP